MIKRILVVATILSAFAGNASAQTHEVTEKIDRFEFNDGYAYAVTENWVLAFDEFGPKEAKLGDIAIIAYDDNNSPNLDDSDVLKWTVRP